MSKELIDFNQSFTLLNKDNTNNWRQKIIATATTYDLKGGIIDEYYLNHACLAEMLYTKDKMMINSYTWQAIISKDLVYQIRKKFNLLSKADISHRTTWVNVQVSKKLCPYKTISKDEFLSTMRTDTYSEIICEMTYKLSNNMTTVLHFPASYINFHKENYQLDIGPVLFIDNDMQPNMAYCAFSTVKENTEFNVLENKNGNEPTLYSKEIEIKTVHTLYQKID